MTTHAIKLSQRYQSPFAVIALDIDNFKRVNDRWGHAIGDRAICHVVNICRQVVRDVDFVGRLGGEEFAIILPETSCGAAANVAVRIRGLLHKQHCITDDNSTIGLTCSFGIAAFKPTDREPDSLLRRADIALYQAKKRGRDRVVVSNDLAHA